MMKQLETQWERLDHIMIAFMTAHGTRLLRVALAVTFIWFGALKVLGRSPVADLVARKGSGPPPRSSYGFLAGGGLSLGVGLLRAPGCARILLSFWCRLQGPFSL